MLDPFFSLNRFEMRLAQVSRPPRDAAGEEPLVGARPSTWRQPRIVVDDLDPGFSVVSETLNSEPTTLLPPYAWNRLGWQRQTDADSSAKLVAWGRYRRTIVRTPAGNGSTRAVFSAEMPEAGAYRLAIHLPGGAVSEGRWRPRSRWSEIRLADSISKCRPSVGTSRSPSPLAMPFPGGMMWRFRAVRWAVRVSLSDSTSDDVVVADAIRWLPEPG